MQLFMCFFVYLSLSSLFCAVVSACFSQFSPEILQISPILYQFKKKAVKVSCHTLLAVPFFCLLDFDVLEKDSA